MAVHWITNPSHVDHAEPREIAEPIELGDDRADASAERDLNDDDPLSLAESIVSAACEAADQAIEAELINWLRAGPDHWPIFRLVLIDP